jgi:DNA-binding MarR family transcriptional regulator
MTPDADPHTAALSAWSVLAEVYQAVVRPVVRRLESEAGIDSGVYSALAYLERADPAGQLPLHELARLLSVRYSQPGVSRLVQRMQHDGLVTRHRDHTDRRAAHVVVTEQGRECFAAAERVYVEAVAAEFGTFVDADQSERLLHVLHAVRDARGRALRPDLLAPPTGASDATDEFQRQQTRQD